jgi:hypothetical protein
VKVSMRKESNESSVVFSLNELMRLEERRREDEAEARRFQEAAARRAAAEVVARERAAEEECLRVAEARRQAERPSWPASTRRASRR